MLMYHKGQHDHQGSSRSKEVSTEPADCDEKGKINSALWHQQSLAPGLLALQESGFSRWIKGSDSQHEHHLKIITSYEKVSK